jgi:hypothetical protein
LVFCAAPLAARPVRILDPWPRHEITARPPARPRPRPPGHSSGSPRGHAPGRLHALSEQTHPNFANSEYVFSHYFIESCLHTANIMTTRLHGARKTSILAFTSPAGENGPPGRATPGPGVAPGYDVRVAPSQRESRAAGPPVRTLGC